MKDWSRGRRAAAISALALLAMIAISLGGWWWAGSPRADLAQWLAATGTAATLVAAIVAAMFAAGAFSLETGREARYRDDQRQLQASSTAAWYGGLKVAGTPSPAGSGRRSWLSSGYTQPGCWIRNASDLPIHQVTVGLVLWGEVHAVLPLGLIPPSDEAEFKPIPAGPMYDALENYRRAIANEGGGEPPAFEVTFVDSSGNRWHRDRLGGLSEHCPSWANLPRGLVRPAE